MNESAKQIAKMIIFYKTLPSEILKEALSNLGANRTIRRQIAKIKSFPEKSAFLLMKNQTRILFVDAVYQTMKDKTDLVLEEAQFMDIAGTINDENKLCNVIFFFRWCYEEGEDGILNEKKYLNDFVDSDLFAAILGGESVENIPFAVKQKEAPGDTMSDEEEPEEENDTEITETVHSEITEDAQTEEPADTADERNDPEQEDMEAFYAEYAASMAQKLAEESKMTYLGYIEKRNTFYNFFPRFELMPDGSYQELSAADLRQEYPTIGGINLYYAIQAESAHFLEDEIIADPDKEKEIRSIYCVTIDNYDLEENINEYYRTKLDLQKLVKRGEKLHEMICNAADCEVYKVVTCEFSTISPANFANGIITLKETNINKEESVLLEYENRFYGPFTAQCRERDGKYYVKPSAENGEYPYLVPFYSEDDVELLEFEKQNYDYNDPTYTLFAHVIGDEKWYDVVPDEVLLDKIVDEVSVDLAITNQEEYHHLCSNSPFLADLPQEIKERRIQRVQMIISNIEQFKDEKRRVFETLLEFYQSETAEVSDKMITESKLYKELQEQYIEQRRSTETAEQQIQELQKELSERRAENAVHADFIVAPEEIAQYQEKIHFLEEQLTGVAKQKEAEGRIESLEKERIKLEATNDYLRSKKDEYTEKIESAQKQVRDAIRAACSGNIESIAERAFDPFISSEMLKAAASWDAQTEKEEYSAIRSAAAVVTASVRSKEELINYIVEYVQARREYSRNEIINIYVSIALNFITIFSGEPGTGKTSMGNIISDTLGLMHFGEKMNRFVSVSVERGWSSKRDLIGYFNPLTRKYDKSSKIYDALRILDAEGTDSRFPYLIMLDEANLSPIEYYWADFMRLTDRSSLNDAYINIGMEQELFVPETLRFIATINTDQTTENLSPRLIDRANIIKLPNVKPKQNVPPTPADCEKITWESFISAFADTSDDLNPKTQKVISSIYDMFNRFGMSVSPRIQLAIEKYVKAAQGIMVEEQGVFAREKALDFAVVQKLLPKINGYYANYERFFEQLKQLCKENNLKMTDKAIDEIVSAQERNMGYCQYLI